MKGVMQSALEMAEACGVASMPPGQWYRVSFYAAPDPHPDDASRIRLVLTGITVTPVKLGDRGMVPDLKVVSPSP
jgi:hypothetical protein